MKYLLFLIWLLGIGAQGQTILNRNSPRYCFKSFILRQHDTCATIGNGGCEITGPLNQLVSMPTALDDIALAEIPDESEWGTKANGSCIIGGPMILNQAINQAQKAADETDGKPLSKLNCTMDAFTHKISPPECADERVDVPAVQRKEKVNTCSGREFFIPNNMSVKQMGEYCYKLVDEVTCADKSRILLHDESGRAHCIKFPE